MLGVTLGLGEGAVVARWVGWSCGGVMVIEAPFFSNWAYLNRLRTGVKEKGVVQNWPFSGNSWKWVGVGRLAPPVESVTRWVRGARGVRQLLLKRW
jgi:hypothetical protein